MRAKIRSLWKEERGVSAVLGAMLILVIIVTLYGIIQAYHVPIWNKNVEFEHLDVVHDDMMAFKSDVEDVALSQIPKSSDIRMGVRYPNRIFLANPGIGVAGALTSESVEVSIEYTIDGLENPTITTSYDSNRIIYEVQGTIDSPKLVYEHGVIIRDYGSEYATTDEQSLIVGDAIYIPVLTENLTASSSMETESIAIKPLSQSPGSYKINLVVITIDTLYPEVWDELLDGTSTADTTVQVDLDENEIIITSTAVRQIYFPGGEVITDALYAGMIRFSTEYTTSSFGTSIDLSQDYPCILNITIEVAGSGPDRQTHSTITATVRNATAPFDINTDLTALTNDTTTYAVIPDYSSEVEYPITATSWEVPNQTTVRWTNFTHPPATQNEGYIMLFRVTNTVNNMQYVVSRVFIRHGNVSWQ